MTQFASTLYPQTNPSNPILVAVREYHVDRFFTVSQVAGLFLRNWHMLNVVEDASLAQRHHALRVLKPLARSSG